MISANHLCIKVTAVEGELVTPTGAAIVAAIRTKDKLPEEFEIKKIGLEPENVSMNVPESSEQ